MWVALIPVEVVKRRDPAVVADREPGVQDNDAGIVQVEQVVVEQRVRMRRPAVPKRAGVQPCGPVLVPLLVLVGPIVRARREALEVRLLTAVEPDVCSVRSII